MITKFAVIVFPGSNCDHDAYNVLKNKFNIDVEFIWHKQGNLHNFDAILIPGGFSYGDYLRTGAIARFSPIMNEVIKDAKKGKPIIGICNGFQILLEAGLLPGSLINNKDIKFISKEVILNVVTKESIFTSTLQKGDILSMPIAHKEGNYICSKSIIQDLEDNDRIVFKYADNPNGSVNDIAGILNESRNVLGMMPHPERACDSILGSEDGKFIFESMLGI